MQIELELLLQPLQESHYSSMMSDYLTEPNSVTQL